MEKEQIINALVCCSCRIPNCENCNYAGDELLRECYDNLKIDALALIKELTEDNERLTEEVAVKVVTLIEFDKQIERLTEENERLKNICNSYALQYGTARDKEVFLRKEREDTVKRFAEKLEITLMSRLVTATKEQKAAILFCINQINQTKAIMTKPKDCLQCKHFVGCEPSTLGGCDLYEEEEKK